MKRKISSLDGKGIAFFPLFFDARDGGERPYWAKLDAFILPLYLVSY